MDGKDTQSRLSELAEKARNGDSEMLEKLLGDRELQLLIYKIANDKVGVEHADDVYQDVLFSVSQKLHTWQGQAEVTTWVARITRNACIDFYRKLQPDKVLVTGTPPEQVSEPDQFRYYSTSEMFRIANDAIQKMGEECRQLLTLHLVEGKEKSDILERVRLPRATFYRKWKGCYETLLKNIQSFL